MEMMMDSLIQMKIVQLLSHLKNYGTQLANNVTATLSLPDTINECTNNNYHAGNFGNIGPNQTVTGSPFQFYIKPECPVGLTIPFELDVASSTSSWIYYRDEIVHGCQLAYTENFIDDDGNILKNYRMDPGETVKVILKDKKCR